VKVINVPEGQYKVIRDGLVNVHPDYIQIQPGFNLRQMFTGIEELADSMLVNGQDTPIIVRRGEDGTLFLVAGERRHRAARLINIGPDPNFRLACIIQDYDQIAADKANGRENLERENLTVYDLVKSAGMLKAQGISWAAVGERLGGISEASAIDYGKLAKLPDKYVKMLIEGPRLKSALIELMRLEGKDLKEGLAEWAGAEKPSWGLARDIVRRFQESFNQGVGGNGNSVPPDEEESTAGGDDDSADQTPLDTSMAQAAGTARKKSKGQPTGDTDSTVSDSSIAGSDVDQDAVNAALGKSPRKVQAPVTKYRNAKEITRFLESLEHPLAKALVKHAQGAYTDKLMAKKWGQYFPAGEAVAVAE
jgi:ParB/RepB/Spo0J family partition protein